MTDTASLADFSPARPTDRRLRLGLQFARLLRAGALTVNLPDGSTHHFEGHEPGPTATIMVRDPRMVARLAFRGSLGLGEAYLEGWWDSPSVIDVLMLGTANAAEWDEMLRGKLWARVGSWLLHKLRPNARKGARRNIADHYDLGNDFYKLWLDDSMTYSAALFNGQATNLEAAQAEKYRRLCRALELKPGMDVLEIGCGWGGFAEIAAGEFGAKVLGITLSTEQLAYGKARMARQGLTDRVELRLQDYRDTPGQFDRIASIEMFEAVGEEYWPAYFNTVRDRLKPGGQAGIQVITIADQFFEEYRTTADFIQRYVFPGGMLPSPTRLNQEVERSGLAVRDVFWFGQDYAETLAIWHTKFQAAWSHASALPARYDTRFKRLWEFYLAYCEAGFRAGWTDVGQVLISRA
ncbi:MAG: SAM-dependent methyltransferase [Rhodospirillales bacterium 20-60-12]|nr:MAG: SAM-dependent methyltransferase [Rhodospirillales bacterium 20-60-12]